MLAVFSIIFVAGIKITFVYNVVAPLNLIDNPTLAKGICSNI